MGQLNNFDNLASAQRCADFLKAEGVDAEVAQDTFDIGPLRCGYKVQYETFSRAGQAAWQKWERNIADTARRTPDSQR